jgi:EAL domain-containing protein (putative c-di-GMP-specific phosphodiesterase class I)/DNA-binding NarL/FixJ family response regulator
MRGVSVPYTRRRIPRHQADTRNDHGALSTPATHGHILERPDGEEHSMDRIRVLLADDEEEVLDVMTDLMASDPAIDVVGRARDARQAIDLARAAGPDVALVDVRMPGGGGPVAARGIRRDSPPTRVVAVSADSHAEAVLAMLDAGATGYVGKEEPVEQILRAVHRAVDGKASLAVSSLASMTEQLVARGSDRTARERRVAGDRISRAIEGSGIDVVFQPIVDLFGGGVAGLEALVRFRGTPRHRSPEAWFAEAASVGLLPELEITAIELAIANLDRIPAGTYLSVNLSPGTICSEELPGVLGDRAHRLMLEVTEGPLADEEGAVACLRSLRDLGAKIAIDDVGAGYAGLSRVVALSPDFIKLDRSVVAGVATDPFRRSLIQRMVSFATDVGIGVIAEGIENEADLEELRALSVPFGQGFHLGRPGPLPEPDGGTIRWPGRHAFDVRDALDPA